MSQQRVFLIHAPIRDLDEFRILAEQTIRLKPHGRVDIDVSSLAGKGFHDAPAGSPWHEYTSCNPCPYKFFPDERIAPFLPADFVQANRQLLLAKVEILREYELGAAFWSYEPNYLPEEFFEAYPHLRGPRVDHPRRSGQEAFSPCVDQEETRAMLGGMVAELVRNVPELGTFFFKTNDAGPGMCWSESLYTGPNGPDYCRRIGTGPRVRSLLEAIIDGAAAGGGQPQIHFTGNFTQRENEDIQRHLPDNCFFQKARPNPSISVGSMISRCYPVRGIVNARAMLQRLQALSDGQGRTVFVDFRSSYDRGYERAETRQKLFDMVEQALAKPFAGLIPTLERLQWHCEQWVGQADAERLFETLVALDEAFRYASAAVPKMRSITRSLSSRQVTRPLVALPENLSADEESYFLPHIFNVSLDEARVDYGDFHGGRSEPLRTAAIDALRSRLEGIGKTLQEISQAAEDEYFGDMAKSVGIYASMVRSAGNFSRVQEVRERRSEDLAAPEHRPTKTPTWTGDPDLLIINDAMRDELDNADQLIGLLAGGGMDLICHSDSPAEEDTFLFGPDLIDQIKRKRSIMRRHWLDIEAHLATPLK